MTRTRKNTIQAALGVAAAAVLAFGTSHAFAAMPVPCDDTKNGEIGECPPYDDESCLIDCVEVYMYSWGNCAHGCCVCVQ